MFDGKIKIQTKIQHKMMNLWKKREKEEEKYKWWENVKLNHTVVGKNFWMLMLMDDVDDEVHEHEI